MNIHDYNTIRTGLRYQARPAGEVSLAAFERDLEDALAESGLFHSIEVGRTDDTERLLIAMVGFAPDGDPQELAEALSELWTSKVGHRFWSASATVVARGHVELQAASRESSQGEYVTLHIVAQAAPVPAQRPVPVQQHAHAVPVAPVPAPRGKSWGWRRPAGAALAGA
ncbi:MAG TPA: hypothetical protein VFK52_04480 [Nocardioidaceae bacterium]|nr:hypothetical protein [Nocardioidaceae bacterium]